MKWSFRRKPPDLYGTYPTCVVEKRQTDRHPDRERVNAHIYYLIHLFVNGFNLIVVQNLYNLNIHEFKKRKRKKKEKKRKKSFLLVLATVFLCICIPI